MVAALSARTGAGTVMEAKTAVHIEVTGADDSTADAPIAISAATVANPTVLTSTAHGLASGETVSLSGFGTTPDINGPQVVTFVSANSFSVPVNVTAVADGVGTFIRTKDASGNPVTERRYYILVDAPAGTDDARSVVFSPSGDGKFVWDDYIFPQDGAYTLRLRNAVTNADVATQAVTVVAAA
jgi:hypothetical protein